MGCIGSLILLSMMIKTRAWHKRAQKTCRLWKKRGFDAIEKSRNALLDAGVYKDMIDAAKSKQNEFAKKIINKISSPKRSLTETNIVHIIKANNVSREVFYMPRKGLLMEDIISAATELVCEKGFEQFSLRQLAGRLDVKPPSLYNHTLNAAEITTTVGHAALQTLNERLQKSAAGKSGTDILLAVADAYRDYANKNEELYKAIVHLPGFDDGSIREKSHSIMISLYKILENYHLSQKEKLLFARAYRSAMHGFVSLEMAGYFQNNIDVDESYHFLIDSLLHRLKDRVVL